LEVWQAVSIARKIRIQVQVNVFIWVFRAGTANDEDPADEGPSDAGPLGSACDSAKPAL
jgi:hypothetical protein